MWQTLAAGCAALLLLSPVALAADSQGRSNVHGLGRVPCKRFVELCEKGATECKLTASWIEGYISALNVTTPETFDLLAWQDSSVVGEFSFNICKRHPDAVLIEAINEIVRQALAPNRIKAASERVRVGEGENTAYLYRESIRRIQQRLADAGHLEGSVDGDFGPGTRAAMAAFQKAAGLPATGMPDQRSLTLLFYGPTARPANGEAGTRPQPERPAAPARSSAPAAGTGTRQDGPPLDLNLFAPRQP